MKKMVPLGFTDENISEGTHMCLIFTSEKERIDSLLQFLLSGLKNNESCSCFTENLTEKDLIQFLKNNNISYHVSINSSALTLSGTNEVYFPEGFFDPAHMLSLLEEYFKSSINKGFESVRVIGEMEPIIEVIPGGDRLLEYESKITLLVRKFPITTICQYDANKFSGGTIMDVLKVHPEMIVNGSVVHNPFFIEPEVYLKCINIGI